MTRNRSSVSRAGWLHGSAALAALIAALPAHAAQSSPAVAPADAAVPAATTGAVAAADAEATPDIIVTSRRREERVQDVPIAISVVSADTVEKTGNFTLLQLQQQAPTLQVINFNPRNTVINIRGLGANSSIAVDGLEYGVGFYVDNVYYARPGQSQFDLIDLQQLEVLRGPQGTLFGKNTTAGAINVTTREPSFTPELTAEGQIGNHEFTQFRASGSVPLIADKVAIRLSGAVTNRGGYLTNAYDGSAAQDYENNSIRGQLLIKPNDKLKIRIIGDYSSQNQHYALTLFDGYFTTFANGATIGNNIFQRAARTGFVLPTTNVFARVGNSNSPFQANMKSYGVSGEVNYDLGGAALTAITAYRWWDWYPANDVDGTPLSVNLKGQQINHQRQFSQELRIASTGKRTIDYVAGLYYFWQVVRGYGASQFGSDFATWSFPGATPPAAIAVTNLALTNYEADSFSNPSTKSYAAFGQTNWHIAEPLTLTVGLRFTHEDKNGEFTRFPLTNSGLNLAGLSAPVLAAIATVRANPAFQLTPLTFTASAKSDALTGLASLAYKVTPDVLLYGSYSRGNKSGGLNLTAGGAIQPVVDPEKVDAFEIGVKSQFLDHSLTINAAAFYTTVRNYQANITVPIGATSVTLQYISNIPKVRSKGIEGDISYAPAPGISLSANAAYTDAYYVSYTNAPLAAEQQYPGNPALNQDLSGVALPAVSKFVYALAADLAKPIDDAHEVYTRVDWLHRSSFNASATNSIYGVIPSYGILSAKIGIRLRDSQLDFSVWARNLLDKDYYLNRSGSNFGLITGTPGDPRTFGGTLRVKW